MTQNQEDEFNEKFVDAWVYWGVTPPWYPLMSSDLDDGFYFFCMGVNFDVDCSYHSLQA